MPKLYSDEQVTIFSTHLVVNGRHYALRDLTGVGFEARHRPQFVYLLSVLAVNSGFFGMFFMPLPALQFACLALFIGGLCVMTLLSQRPALYAMTVTDASGKHDAVYSTDEDYLHKLINVTRRGIKYEKMGDAAPRTRGYATA